MKCWKDSCVNRDILCVVLKLSVLIGDHKKTGAYLPSKRTCTYDYAYGFGDHRHGLWSPSICLLPGWEHLSYSQGLGGHWWFFSVLSGDLGIGDRRLRRTPVDGNERRWNRFHAQIHKRVTVNGGVPSGKEQKGWDWMKSGFYTTLRSFVLLL